jgi:hypothetical protein
MPVDENLFDRIAYPRCQRLRVRRYQQQGADRGDDNRGRAAIG